MGRDLQRKAWKQDTLKFAYSFVPFVNMKRSLTTLGTILLAAAGWGFGTTAVLSQTATSVCQPPRADEYLLLVRNPTPEKQSQVQQILPTTADVSICRYDNQSVIRVSGFSTLDVANAWASYVTEVSGSQTVVLRPSRAAGVERSPATPPTASQPSQPATAATYRPQGLGAGYAVLVDYRNQPAIATQVQQLLGQEIGVATYGQRPYLLAGYTANPTAASELLKTLSDRGLLAILVDGRRVVLLKPTVALPTSQ